MNVANRKTERVRREQAHEDKGAVVSGSGRAVEARNLEQMVSVRLDDVLVGQLRELADRRDLSLSSLIRQALGEYTVRSESTSRIEWQVTNSQGTIFVETKEWRERPSSRSALRDTSAGAAV
jgi:predicted transcriptional regulator